MLIEFIGPSGSGKTTLITELGKHLDQIGVQYRAIHEKIQGTEPLPAFLRDPRQHNIKTDLWLLLWASFALLQSPRFSFWVLVKAMHRPEPLWERLQSFRAIMRKAGIRRFLQNQPGTTIWDEGLSHSAQVLLVNSKEPPSDADIREFVRLLPKKSLVVLVQSSLKTILERSLSRNDFYPPMTDVGEIQRFSEHSIKLFQKLASNPLFEENLISAEDNIGGAKLWDRISEDSLSELNSQ
jgi:hypothetical protein